MPSYSTRKPKPKKKKQQVPKRLPKDPRKLLHWAGTGSEKDYDRLRTLAARARKSVPTHIDGVAVEKLMHTDRLEMIEQIQAAEQHDVSAGAFLDAVNWVLGKVPFGSWLWPVKASQGAINARKGDGLNEVDAQYARLVGATYGKVEDRPFVADHWKRQTQFDSSYVSVWDNPDGHRVICVRGTQGTGDVGEDLLVGLTGRSTNRIGNELLQILAATPEATVVDLAAHSLGTSLALQAYSNSAQTFDAIHETYLYNPAYSPVLKGSADKYERDARVRYFINFNDPVSMGGLGHRAPSNVVYRTGGTALSAHKLTQWEGSGVLSAQYHAPPETRVHAHKALFGPKSVYGEPVFDYDWLIAHTTLDTQDKDAPVAVGQDGSPVREPDSAPATFDFGEGAPFDYDGL